MVDAEVTKSLGHVADGWTKKSDGEWLLRGLTGSIQLTLVFNTIQQDIGNLHHKNSQVNKQVKKNLNDLWANLRYITYLSDHLKVKLCCSAVDLEIKNNAKDVLKNKW